MAISALSANIFSLMTLDVAKIDWQSTYLLCSIFVAVLVIFEAIALYRNQGQIPEDSWVQSVTLLDIIWLVVSGVALYYVHFHPMAKIIPILFIIYNVFGWVYSLYLFKDDIDEMNIDSFDDIVIPKPYIDYSMSFGFVCTLAIGAVLFFLYQHKLVVLATLT